MALLSELSSKLASAGFESPDLEASILVADSLRAPLAELPLQRARKLAAADEAKIRAAFARRLAHEPLQYIFGEAHFRFLKLAVGPGCLIPRPETELLAEIVLKAAPPFGLVCELGAGSGALGLSIASERRDLRVFASELSPEAFKWADANRRALALPNYELRRGSLFSPFEGLRFDVVAANLPYIPSEEMASLPPEVGLREPSLALDGGPGGLEIVKLALADARRFLKPGGLLALEVAESHGDAMLKLFGAEGLWRSCEIRKDLCGKDRFALALSASC